MYITYEQDILLTPQTEMRGVNTSVSILIRVDSLLSIVLKVLY